MGPGRPLRVRQPPPYQRLAGQGKPQATLASTPDAANPEGPREPGSRNPSCGYACPRANSWRRWLVTLVKGSIPPCRMQHIARDPMAGDPTTLVSTESRKRAMSKRAGEHNADQCELTFTCRMVGHRYELTCTW